MRHGPALEAKARKARHAKLADTSTNACRSEELPDRTDLPGLCDIIMSYFLFAESELAKTFQGTHGPDILVGDDTKIGRSVSGRDSCRLPAKWAQVSGTHCRIFYTSLKVLLVLPVHHEQLQLQVLSRSSQKERAKRKLNACRIQLVTG